MTTLAHPSPPLESHLLLDGISWEYYESTIQELEDAGSHVRVTYDDGRMEFMSPSTDHELAKKYIARLIELYTLEKDIPIIPFGSMTCRRRDLKKGLEPDECYYVRHMPANQKIIDLQKDPPPDLVVEVDITTRSIPRQPIYAALGVPEIWRYVHDRVIVMLRQPNGQYKPADRSLALPNLPMDKFVAFLRRLLSADPKESLRTLKEFQKWAKST